jgi:hypothetical protein
MTGRSAVSIPEAAKEIGNRIWPDVTTQKGAGQATLAGAAALAWLAGAYSIRCIRLLRSEQIIGGQELDEQNWYFPIISLIAAAVATSYLAIRVMDHHCLTAAWMSLLWIAFETVAAFLGISTGNPVISLILLFAALQGVRGTQFSSDLTHET